LLELWTKQTKLYLGNSGQIGGLNGLAFSLPVFDPILVLPVCKLLTGVLKNWLMVLPKNGPIIFTKNTHFYLK
jgi:hypothetical protein